MHIKRRFLCLGGLWRRRWETNVPNELLVLRIHLMSVQALMLTSICDFFISVILNQINLRLK
ncbi:hypothetical protein HU200_058876 [Digitaria exilis]|uniref:Uncharacterized protein n=1 Tax=Digitaria exilis TaxID=1010633 RepID=A0A835ABZ2_9POAL|nr:hypothetical protein HU200_058876 [Digitaria exilis]